MAPLSRLQRNQGWVNNIIEGIKGLDNKDVPLGMHETNAAQYNLQTVMPNAMSQYTPWATGTSALTRGWDAQEDQRAIANTYEGRKVAVSESDALTRAAEQKTKDRTADADIANKELATKGEITKAVLGADKNVNVENQFAQWLQMRGVKPNKLSPEELQAYQEQFDTEQLGRKKRAIQTGIETLSTDQSHPLMNPKYLQPTK